MFLQSLQYMHMVLRLPGFMMTLFRVDSTFVLPHFVHFISFVVGSMGFFLMRRSLLLDRPFLEPFNRRLSRRTYLNGAQDLSPASYMEISILI